MSEHNDQTSHSTLSGWGAVYDEVKTYRVKYVEELEAKVRMSLAWKRAAKKWRAGADEYYSAYREELTNKNELGIKWALAKATADRRKELLREAVELLYTIVNHYAVNEITTTEMIEKIEKELADAVGSQD